MLTDCWRENANPTPAEQPLVQTTKALRFKASVERDILIAENNEITAGAPLHKQQDNPEDFLQEILGAYKVPGNKGCGEM